MDALIKRTHWSPAPRDLQVARAQPSFPDASAATTPAPAMPETEREDPRLLALDAALIKARESLAQRDAEIARLNATLEALQHKARETGFAQGQQEGAAKALKEHEAALQALQALAQQFSREVAARLANAEDAMVTIAYTALVNVLDEQLANVDALRAMVRRCVAQVSAPGLFAVHVAPSDYRALTQTTDAPAAPDDAFTWVADATISPGGCVIEHKHGALDGRLATQLSAITQALLEARAKAR
jgi:flagellar assembly protein FliH